jgi:thiol-disulfide isomerase/thioredoxin
MKILIFALSLMLCGLQTSPAGVLDKQLDGKLLRMEKGKTAKVPPGSLAKKKYLLFYYSASWCPPCHLVTPMVIENYNKWKASQADFEIILIGLDRSAADLEAYVRDFSIPFPFLSFEHIEKIPQINQLKAAGPPYLVVTNLDGKELIGRGSQDWVHASEVMEKFEARLKANK